MTVKERVSLCLMLEKMHQQNDYRKKLKLEDLTTFQGRSVEQKERSQ